MKARHAARAAQRDAAAAELGRRIARNEAAAKGLITELAQLGDSTSSASIAYRTRIRIREHFTQLHDEAAQLKNQLGDLDAQAAKVSDAALISQLPHAPGLLAQAPDDIRAALFAALQVQCTHRADQKQVTIRVTITDSTPGIVAALLADPRTGAGSPKGSPAPFDMSDTVAMTANKAGDSAPAAGGPPAPVGVVGAGIVGLAVARQLTAAGVPVVVFEKETAVATHQTGHNSGVVHAGIYYPPGSAKARMTRRGVALLRAYCTGRGLAYDERGKLVVARNEAEAVKLRELERRSRANGVPGVQWLPGAGLRELEPDVAGVAALHSPGTAIVDYPAIARSFAADVTASGGSVLTGTPVTALRVRGGDRVEADTPAGAHTLSRLVICAGLQADLLAAAAGDTPAPEIIPFRGEYLRLLPHAAGRVRRLIYPVPDPRYPFLGVHLTPRVDGTADLGPNAVLALAREGYRRRDVSLDELWRLARSGAFWRLARRHWMTGVREVRGSLWRRAYLAEARTYLPWITLADVTSGPAGVRAQAVDANGGLVDDFRISQAGPVTSVRNAPSPAATASMAIAEHIAEKLGLPLSSEER